MTKTYENRIDQKLGKRQNLNTPCTKTGYFASIWQPNSLQFGATTTSAAQTCQSNPSHYSLVFAKASCNPGILKWYCKQTLIDGIFSNVFKTSTPTHPQLTISGFSETASKKFAILPKWLFASGISLTDLMMHKFTSWHPFHRRIINPVVFLFILNSNDMNQDLDCILLKRHIRWTWSDVECPLNREMVKLTNETAM